MSRRHRSTPALVARQVRRTALRFFGTVAPRTASTWFERALLTPSRSAVPSAPTLPAPDVTLRLPYGHGWLHVRAWGEGPTVLLMHGWGAETAHLGAFVAPLMAAGHRVVGFDAPAHGASDGVMTNLVDCAGATLQVAARVGPIHGIVAHSFGGPSAALAIRHGLAPRRLVFIAPPASMEETSHEYADLMGFPRRVAERMTARVGSRLGVTWADIRTDRLLQESPAPLLVLHDVDDRQVPVRHGAELAEAVGARFIATTGLGHRRIVEDPVVIRHAVGFLGVGA